MSTSSGALLCDDRPVHASYVVCIDVSKGAIFGVEEARKSNLHFPGGKRETKDRDSVATCIRETEEETPLRPKPRDLTAIKPYVTGGEPTKTSAGAITYPDGKMTYYIWVQNGFEEVDEKSSDPDVLGFYWIPFDEVVERFALEHIGPLYEIIIKPTYRKALVEKGFPAEQLEQLRSQLRDTMR